MQNELMEKHWNLVGIRGWTNRSKTQETRNNEVYMYVFLPWSFYGMNHKRKYYMFFLQVISMNEMTLEWPNT
jgi:hypothetical protein